MTPNPYTRFAVAGGSGNLGRLLVMALAQKGFDVISLTRGGNTESHPSTTTARAVVVDYGDRSALMHTLKDRQVVINAAGLASLQSDFQDQLAIASAAAGVELFVPNDWGYDIDLVNQRNNPPLHAFLASKRPFHARLQELGLARLGFDNGVYTSFFPVLTQMDKTLKTAVIAGNGDVPFVITAEQDVAIFVSQAFATLPKAELLNKQLRVAGATVTLSGVFSKLGYSVQRDALETVQKDSTDLALGFQSFIAWTLLAIERGSAGMSVTDNARIGFVPKYSDITLDLAGKGS